MNQTPYNPLRAIFMGTAAVTRPVLAALREWPGVHLAGVVTQPARPRGRRLHVALSPVQQSLAGVAIPVFAPENVNAGDSLEWLRAAAPDVIVVMAYGQFLGRALLDLPALGCINVHLSLLPKYRGAAPVQWAIARGESETGVSVIEMTERMDAGAVLAQTKLAIKADDTALSLGRRLAAAAPEPLLETLARRARGDLAGTPQDESAVTRAPLLKKSDGLIDWNRPAALIERRLRGFSPWPGAYCRPPAPGAPVLKVLRATVRAAPDGKPCPGTLLSVVKEGPIVSAGRDALCLTEVQPEGRRPMSGADYVRGRRLREGDRFV